jgi:hypothetical protein
MTELTPNQVALNLAQLARDLQKLSDEMDELEVTAVTAGEDYTREYAKAFLDEDGPVETKKQKTLWVTRDFRLAAEIAETMVKAHKRKIDVLKVRIDVGRSAAALVRAESELLQVRR